MATDKYLPSLHELQQLISQATRELGPAPEDFRQLLTPLVGKSEDLVLLSYTVFASIILHCSKSAKIVWTEEMSYTTVKGYLNLSTNGQNLLYTSALCKGVSDRASFLRQTNSQLWKASHDWMVQIWSPRNGVSRVLTGQHKSLTIS